MNKLPNFEEILREAGSKVTPGRLELLKILWLEPKPVTAAYLGKKLKSLNPVTLYRALEYLISSKIVREIDFRHGHTHYELNIFRNHHHHLVCTGCGIVEDVPCGVNLKIKKPSIFKVIDDHAMEFFGICRRCA